MDSSAFYFKLVSVVVVNKIYHLGGETSQAVEVLDCSCLFNLRQDSKICCDSQSRFHFGSLNCLSF